MRKYILFNLLLNTIFFQFVTADDIIINEIMYNSPGTDVEFVELYNSSILVVNLQGCYLLDDNEAHIPCYLEGNLEPGKFLIVAGDVSLFTSNYPGVGPINSQDFGTGTDGWSLGNGGDVVRLYSASHQLLDIVAYEDGNEWPGSADGNGSSLELLNPNFDNALSISWDPSSVAGGTPGSENSVLTNNIMPVCKDGYRGIDLPESGISVPVMVTAYDFEGLSKVELMVDAGDGFSPIIMTDDGQGDDFAAGDSIYTATIPGYSGGTLVKYYAVATDNVNQSDSWPNNAPAEYRAYTIDYKPPDLRITEVLAVNDRVNRDAYGEYDDWVEIYNNDDRTINLEGLYLSNDMSNSQGFELPDRELAPGAYVLIWADNDFSQGDLHADFKLSSEGEAVALFESIEHGNVLIDGWQYGRMSADISMGFPSMTATAPEYLSTPSPGASNTASSLFSPVCINEFLTTSNFGGIDDWIEIFNRGQVDYDLSGCFLADGRRNNTQWTFPAGTVLKPNDYLVIYEDALGFSLTSGGGDVIMLTAADSVTGLDFYDFGSQNPDQSEGRYPDGTSTWQRLNEQTPGSANTGANSIDMNSVSLVPRDILYANYPNPFNPVTVIPYELSADIHVNLSIYNLRGQCLEILIDQNQTRGKHQVHWDASCFPSGVYFIRLKTDRKEYIRKCILLQ
ncbi:MAG: lamin tail domain-containing protein [Candidatus Marinimicrobia bacterium]|nr:lamin tail domain-containing protein [Candidatus Neomarinimicrobiota bacterium]